jgi:phosphoribosylaminoimidazole-succinocarboxamide synthase
MTSPTPLFETQLKSLPLKARGKVRDIYDIDDQTMLIVTTDRLSAFDCILPDPIPGKGGVLTRLSEFWFKKLGHIVPTQMTNIPLEEVLTDPTELAILEGRAIVVKKLKALPVEAVVRGYLIGSGWKDYLRNGAVCGIQLPKGLRFAEKLPEPLFTPSTKAEFGLHDQNIDFETTQKLFGAELAEAVRAASIRLYSEAAEYAIKRGIIIADTKFEFGLDEHGTLHLIDEVLTPDSSRFWPLDEYQIGENPPSFDKQMVRDYLETLSWDKKDPAPGLPPNVISQTSSKYHEVENRLKAAESLAVN